MPFRVLHSADWHLGKRLYHKSRQHEYRLFLNWLLEQLPAMDLLLIAGDVFDTNSPPVWAQELYYQFLHRASQHCPVVICAGNHDSSLFLEAPRALLAAMQVHVIGNPSQLLQNKVQAQIKANPAKHIIEARPQCPQHPFQEARGYAAEIIPELIPIYQGGTLQALICALPYLKDSYLRSSHWEESWQDKEQKIQTSLATYYQVLANEAQRFLQQQNDTNIPIIAMGHLFASGATTVANDGVRELYIGSTVGSLGHFSCHLLPPDFDYVALGHIHQAQQLKAATPKQQVRYSGSPIRFSFGEKGAKTVLRLEFEGKNIQVEKLAIPQWQRLEKICGNAEQLQQGIQALAQNLGQNQLAYQTANQTENQVACWLELELNDTYDTEGLREKLSGLADKHNMEILRYRSPHSLVQSGLSGQNSTAPTQTLNELTPEEVFRRCLQVRSLPSSNDKIQERKQPKEPKDSPLWPLYQSLLSDITLQRGPSSEPQEGAR